jgi:hypothetical protein
MVASNAPKVAPAEIYKIDMGVGGGWAKGGTLMLANMRIQSGTRLEYPHPQPQPYCKLSTKPRHKRLRDGTELNRTARPFSLHTEEPCLILSTAIRGRLYYEVVKLVVSRTAEYEVDTYCTHVSTKQSKVSTEYG